MDSPANGLLHRDAEVTECKRSLVVEAQEKESENGE
jgi:hypothetical protein